MGIVYRAWQSDLGREVALKLLPGGPLAPRVAVERLRAEASALGRLRHPGIVTVHEVGRTDGQTYVAMELIRGGNLAEAVADLPVPPREAAEHARQVARAIQHAHEAGVWHRDLKPSNILIDEDGRLRVTDFGLATLADGLAPETHSGQFLGTPGFLAPEQVDSSHGPVGPWTDIHALGALLYYLLTGKPVFGGGSLGEILHRTLSQDPAPPRALNPAAPADLETVCLKCLAKDPADRYANAGAVADELDLFLADRPVTARPLGPLPRLWRWRRRNPVLAALTVLLAVGTAVSFTMVWSLWRQAETETRRSEKALTQLRRDRITEMFAADQPLLALSLLGDLLREDPADRLAAERARSALTWLSHPLPERVFRGHGGAVVSVAFNPGETAALSASADGTARIWRLDDPGSAPVVLRSGAPLAAAKYSSDGYWIVTAGEDGVVTVWHGNDGTLWREFAHPAPVRGLDFSPDGSRLATACEDGRARLWDVGENGAAPLELLHGHPVLAIRFDAGGDRVVTGGQDGTGRVWDTRSGAPAGPPLRHDQRVVDAAFSPDGAFAATSSWDGSLKVWDAATGSLAVAGPLDNSWVNTFAFSPDGTRLLSGGQSTRVNLWTIGTPPETALSWWHAQAVIAVAFSSDGQTVLSASLDGSVRVREAASGKKRVLPLMHGGGVRAAAFSRDGTRVLSGAGDGTVAIWSVLPGEAVPRFFPHPGLGGARWSAGGSRVLTWCDQGTIRLRHAAGGEDVAEGPAVPTRLVAVVPTPDGGRVLATGRDGAARVWDISTGAVRELAPRHRRGMWTADVAPDGRHALTASWDGTARLWDLDTGLPASGPWEHDSALSAAAFDPTGRRAATGSRDGVVRIWSLPGGELLADIAAHAGDVLDLHFSPDGRWLLSASTDRTAKTWDAATGRSGAVLRHENEINRARFSPDGRRVATASKDRTVKLWELPSGTPAGLPLAHRGIVHALAFDPAGQRLATGGHDGVARLWDAETGYLLGHFPMEEADGLAGVEFSPDGRFLLAAHWTRGALIRPVPPAAPPTPEWFLDLIDTLTAHVPRHPGESGNASADIATLRTRMEAAPGSDDWKAWGEWFFADRATRPPAPF